VTIRFDPAAIRIHQAPIRCMPEDVRVHPAAIRETLARIRSHQPPIRERRSHVQHIPAADRRYCLHNSDNRIRIVDGGAFQLL